MPKHRLATFLLCHDFTKTAIRATIAKTSPLKKPSIFPLGFLNEAPRDYLGAFYIMDIDSGIPADATNRKFTGVWIPAAIWLDDSLSGLAKMLYAEIASFGENGCWKRSDELREPLGVGSDAFQRLCRQLREAGYISERRAFGRIVRATTLGFQSSTEKSHQPQKPANEQPENAVDEQPQKPGVHIEYTKEYTKEHKRAENGAQSVENPKKSYGRDDVNEMVKLWQQETSIAIDETNQRRQLYNLIRKYGLDSTRAIIKRVGAMRKAKDRYAPSIMKPSDLTGKFGKLDKLIAWEERQELNQPKLASAPKWYFDKPPVYEEISEDERAEVAEQFKEARKRLKFLQNNS